MKKILLYIGLVGIGFQGMSQDFKCGTGGDELDAVRNTPESILGRQELQKLYDQTIEQIRNNPSLLNQKAEQVFVVPVVFHIMHNYESVYNTFMNNRQTYKDAITRMNDDYANLANSQSASNINAPFNQISDPVNIEFRLARIDPDGKCTEGFTLTQTEATMDATNENIKPLIQWNPEKYLNIWIVNNIASGAGAWSHIPPVSPSIDGIVCRNGQLSALAHEAGHWLALPHPWGGTNDPNVAVNCSDDDGISDTPNTIGGNSVSTCSASRVSCTDDPVPFLKIDGSELWPTSSGQIPDNTQNVMDYNFCSKENFTQGQKVKMRTTIQSTANNRKNLWTAANLAATGTADTSNTSTCAPIGNFSADPTIICENTSVKFKSEVYNGTVTTYAWDFGDGSATSSASSPLHTYTTEGAYTVTLTVSNAKGSNETVKTSYITVKPITGGEVAPFYENFENTNFPARDDGDTKKEWSVVNGYTAQKWILDTSSYTGVYSYALRLKDIPTGKTYELISPILDFTQSKTCADMTFRYAYAKKSSSSNDVLEIYVNKDCGDESSWTAVDFFSATDLSTVSDFISTKYVPEKSDWKEGKVNLADYQFDDHILVKFKVTTNGGNMLYIDDINFGCDPKSGINELSNSAQINVYPNPFVNDATIEVNVSNSDKYDISIINVLGEQVYSENRLLTEGKHKLSFNAMVSEPTGGIYFVKLSSSQGYITQKIVKY